MDHDVSVKIGHVLEGLSEHIHILLCKLNQLCLHVILQGGAYSDLFHILFGPKIDHFYRFFTRLDDL